jgi:hypothetical protein
MSTHNIQNATSIPPAGLEPARERPLAHCLDRAVTGNGCIANIMSLKALLSTYLEEIPGWNDGESGAVRQGVKFRVD